MKKRSKTVLLIVSFINVLCLIIFAPVVYSADFTFHVPVELNNIPPHIKTAFVACYVFDKPGDVTPEHMICAPQSRFDLIGGRYSGTVVLSLDAEPGKDKMSAKAWNCNVLLITPDGHSILPTYILTTSGPYLLDSSKPVKVMTSGNIP